MKLEYIFAFFAIIAILDKITGNHFKLGKEFDKAISMAQPLIISMTGMIVLAPVISEWCVYAFSDMVRAIGLDISFIGSFFPSDSGGASIAYELSDNRLIAGYNGIIIASMFGATICPVVPMALNMIDKKYHDDILFGFLCGFATIPIGCFAAGFIIKLPFIDMLKNSAPTIILSIIICIGLIKKPNLMQKIVSVVGKTLFTVTIIGLGIGIIDKLTGFKIIPGIAPIDDALAIVWDIMVILTGIMPLLAIVTRVCKKVFSYIGKFMNINNYSVTGLITTMANCIPMFDLVSKMDKKGRSINMAFVVSSSFVLGDHLAFTLAFDKSFVLPLIVGKLLSGITAIILVNIILKNKLNEL